ncbi:MAG TPA: leucine-rich repeat domain-containing protein [Candidatus Saccharimonadales bacterium]|nr:leucine-rich repeat domain-containing protein [Candidatus Saccharimonadales bacterium]
METYKQIKNPDSGQFIYIYGPTYQKLLKKYDEDFLLLQTIRTTYVAPRSPKTQRLIHHHRQVDLNEDVLREILSHADIQSVFQLCQVNKTLCHQHDHVFQHMYDRFYHETDMAVFKTGNMTWFQLLKMCYQLSRLLLLLPSLKNYTIKSLYTIKGLPLSGLKINVVPPEIGQLRDLQTLSLSDNQLSTLPPEIGRLGHLQYLNLSHNQLSKLPLEMGQLSALQYLDLSYNQLSALPPEMGRLSALQELNLSKNQLSALPKEIGHLNKLKELYLTNNQLRALPPEIGHMSALQRLSLSNNQLSALPTEMGQLSILEELDLSKNNLSSTLKNELKRKLPNTTIYL